MKQRTSKHSLRNSGNAGADPQDVRIMPDFEDFQNPLKIFHHSDRIHELQATGDTRPVHMTIGLTNYCNHKCSWCYINWHQAGRASERSGAGDRSRKSLNADQRLIEAVGEARDMGLKAVTIVGDGEPTLHENFAEILHRLDGMGLQVGLFSNLGTTDPGILKSIIDYCFFVRGSIDAASAEVHRLSHGAEDFDLVIGNLKKLVELRNTRSRPAIGVQFVTNHWNAWQLPEAALFYRDIGVDYLSIKPAYKNLLNPAHPENEISREETFDLMREAQSYSTGNYKVYAKYPQFEEVIGHKTNDARYYGKCRATPLSPYLDEDGIVEMCGNLKGRGFSLGNVHESSFSEIWNSERRKDCLARIDLLKCPSGCKLDPLNKVLWDAFYPKEDNIHPNFV